MKYSKEIFLSILLAVLIPLSLYLVYIDEITIAIFSMLFAVFTLIILLINIFDKDPYKKYNNNINSILKTYDCILVEIENLPDLDEKKIIRTQSFQDIANTEYEVRKPVYYIHNEDSYDFILIDTDDAYTYTERKDESVKSLLDNYIIECKKNEELLKTEEAVISNLEKTTIIKISENEMYRISPIRNK